MYYSSTYVSHFFHKCMYSLQLNVHVVGFSSLQIQVDPKLLNSSLLSTFPYLSLLPSKDPVVALHFVSKSLVL